ncbi:ABC transporter permease [Sphingobacterium sp.]|uniref:ABC transporter permease n=1 Tax=Sphingobacterium sp. TaxID=341027 RepID=UPI0028AC9584|nr:FtsX-like permease family protein [Sphingobacterium sp.]
MFRLLITNSIRHLKRNPLFTFLNVLGLTIGISSCWVIYKYVSFELSFEKGLPQKENTYRLLSHFKTEDRDELFSGISRPIYFALQEDPKGLDMVVPYFRKDLMNVSIPEIPGQEKKYEEPTWDETSLIETTPDLFELVGFHWLAGNKEFSLKEPHQLVLTEDRAKHYFPKLSPQEVIGKTLIYNDSVKRIVSGVIQNLEFPTEFNGQEYFLVQKSEKDNMLQAWGSSNGADKVYLLAKNQKNLLASKEQIQRLVDSKWRQIQNEKLLPFDFERTMVTMPIRESHFSTDMSESGASKTNKKVIFSLVAVAIFLLGMACINYVNLTTAQIPQRSKEIGIRKTLGGSNGSLISQLMIETSLIVLFSFILSYFISDLGFIALGDLISDPVKNYSDPLVITIFIIITFVATVIFAGIFPSILFSKVNSVDIFRNKGHVSLGNQKIDFRKGLIIFQFIIAQVFIVAGIIIGQQLNYVIRKDMGFNKDAVILTHVPFKVFMMDNYHERKILLADELRKINGIESVTMGNVPISNSYSSNKFEIHPEDGSTVISKELYSKTIDSAYLKFYDIKLLAGSELYQSDTTNGYLINETALIAFGFKRPEDAIGKFLFEQGKSFPIMGVVKDFHTQDFYSKISPMVLMYDKNNLQDYSIHLSLAHNKNWPTIIETIKYNWAKYFPMETFSTSFYDDNIASFYKKEQHLHKLTNISTGIAIILSCLGLFGLSTVSAFQRTKEICIRKVLGASISGIVVMLTKDFVKMVIVAFFIASPIVWLVCNEWLKDFVYRVEISWTTFILGGLLAIISALLTVGYQAIKVANSKPVENLKDE